MSTKVMQYTYPVPLTAVIPAAAAAARAVNKAVKEQTASGLVVAPHRLPGDDQGRGLGGRRRRQRLDHGELVRPWAHREWQRAVGGG
jgi:hypothetical protein